MVKPENAVLFFPEKLSRFILKTFAKRIINPIANAKDGTNKNRSPTVAPLIKKRLFVGDELRKKNKIKNENKGCFLN
jgi:hypothetical protein